jgi:hypothetical protein
VRTAGATATLTTPDRRNPVRRVGGRHASVIKTTRFLEDDPTGLRRSIASVHDDGADPYRVLEPAEGTGSRVTRVDEWP